MTKTQRLRTCGRCGWVHFGVSIEAAGKALDEFNDFFNALSATEQQNYYGGRGGRLIDYLACAKCGGSWRHFRPAQPGDCPDGSTISPILIAVRKRPTQEEK